MSRSVTGLPDNDMDYDTVCGNGPYPDDCEHGQAAESCGKCAEADIQRALFERELERDSHLAAAMAHALGRTR